ITLVRRDNVERKVTISLESSEVEKKTLVIYKNFIEKLNEINGENEKIRKQRKSRISKNPLSKSMAEVVRGELENLKKQNKELYKLKIQELKLGFAELNNELDKLKTGYPEFESALEEIVQESLKMVPEEERDEVGGVKPTN
ncbi:1826_t:CDS:2, partial [Funneliformis caledonium]